MDVSYKESGDWAQTVTVTVPKEQYAEEFTRQLKGIQKTHRQRGFRPGKVPMKVIKAKFGNAVRFDVADKLLQKTMPKVIEKLEDGIIHISQPKVLAIAEGEAGLRFEFEAERMPKLEPANYVGIEVEKTVIEVPDDAVNAALEEVRTKHAWDEPVDRQTVEDGDVVKFVYADDKGGEDGEEPTEHEVTIEKDKLVGGLYEGLLGATVGEETSMTLTPPNGDAFDVSLVVKGIYRKALPELDDELAVDDGRAQTLLELRLLLRKELEEQYVDKAKSELEVAVGEKLVEFNPFELPQGFFEARLEDEVKQRLAPLLGQGVDLNQLGLDLSGFKDNMRDGFAQMMKRSFLIEAIADKEEITATEEEIDAFIDEKITDPRQKRMFEKPEARADVSNHLRLEKALEWIVEQAKVTEVTREPSHFDEPAHDHEHSHDHGEEGGHDHDHSHEHGEDCGHDHDHGHEHSDAPVDGQDQEEGA